MANGLNKIGKCVRVYGSDGELAATLQVYEVDGEFQVSRWDAETDRFSTVETFEFDGPVHGPDAKAARAMAFGCRDSLAALEGGEVLP